MKDLSLIGGWTEIRLNKSNSKRCSVFFVNVIELLKLVSACSLEYRKECHCFLLKAVVTLKD